MLATKTSARQALRLRRCSRQFATAIEAAGIKVSAVDNSQPTSSVTFLIKAGSRYETKPGVAHFLKNFAFKSTTKRSALGTVREAELYGGVLSSSLTREHLAFTAEFLRGDEEYFVDVLSSLVTSPKFTRWELTESVLPVVEAELQAVSAGTQAVELAHKLAFRTGLGSSIFAPKHAEITSEDVKRFASSTFVKGNIAVLGTGIDQSALTKLVEKNLGAAVTSTAPTTSPSKYFGGETRVALLDTPQTIFLGFGTTGIPSAELSVLANHLSGKASVKWLKGLSPLISALPEGVSAESVLLPYSDATLFGLLIQSPSGEKLKEAGKAAVDALKAGSTANGIKPDDLKKAIAKAKFSAASSAEDRDGLVATFGPRVLEGKPSPLEDTLSALDKVNESAFSKAVSALLKTNPTYVALGDLDQLPYRDEIGL